MAAKGLWTSAASAEGAKAPQQPIEADVTVVKKSEETERVVRWALANAQHNLQTLHEIVAQDAFQRTPPENKAKVVARVEELVRLETFVLHLLSNLPDDDTERLAKLQMFGLFLAAEQRCSIPLAGSH